MKNIKKINNENDPFKRILNYIVITNGDAFGELIDKTVKKDKRINKYRESLLNISKSFPIAEIAAIKKNKQNPQNAKKIGNMFSDYLSYQLVNFFLFIGLLSKDFNRIENFINNDSESNRLDIHIAEASQDLKLYALFEGFLKRKTNNVIDPMYSYASNFIRGLANEAELLKSRETLRKFKQININYTEIFNEIIFVRKNKNKSNTKILSEIAQKKGLKDHTSIIKTFNNKLPLLKDATPMIIRYRLKYDKPEIGNTNFKIKPLKLIFEIAKDDELVSIGRELDNLI